MHNITSLPADRPPMKYFKRVPLPFKLVSQIITRLTNWEIHFEKDKSGNTSWKIQIGN